MNVVGLFGWIAAWVGLLAILVVFLSPAFIPLLLPFMVIAFYRAFIQVFYFPWAMRMRRILRHYPWQVMHRVPRGLHQHPDARDNGPWFEIGDPANPEKTIPLVFLRTMRRYWWTKRIGGPRTKPELKAQIEPLWFAGDPRFLSVIAASDHNDRAPKRMYVLYQRPALDKRVAPLSWEAGPDEIDRARRAGARVPDA